MRTNHLKSILAVDDSRTRAQTVPASIAARPANYPFRTEPRSRLIPLICVLFLLLIVMKMSSKTAMNVELV
ncbi:hypothetical protein CUMW_158150 [Citrus unshiu]|uniref:Uncharacterized protein n=1 Tax=Citrus unshiu TaxID=55188 RepID=A0A2H5PQH3_CITUN|nr:hypothetical protein CUMW_158150 [Citrus unshiu]